MKPIDETTINRNLEYIKLEWADIHHSRQQEWGALVVIAGIFYAIAQIDPNYPDNPLEAKILLALLGAFCAFLGAWVCWQHHEILQQKTLVIVQLERQIGIQYPTRDVWFPVQILLFWLFGGICCTFIGLTLAYLAKSYEYKQLINWAYAIALVLFVFGFLGFAVYRRKIAKKHVSYGYTHPFHAELNDLESCLNALGEIPLKLIAGEIYNRSTVKEVVWKNPKWEWTPKGDEVKKYVLLNRRDAFQFSLANANSKQDWHMHANTFEIYVSECRIEIGYIENNKEMKLETSRGVLIVPPNIHHKVKLSGITYVFQAMLSGRRLGLDKIKLFESNAG